MVGATAGLGWLLILTTPIAEPAADLPSREQLLFMLEFSDAQGDFVDPFEIQTDVAETAIDADQSAENDSAREGRTDDDLK